MPRAPLGERAMTDAERQRKRRERLRQEQPPKLSDRQKLIEAQAELATLKAEAPSWFSNRRVAVTPIILPAFPRPHMRYSIQAVDRGSPWTVHIFPLWRPLPDRA
jgi:hypothetical protein